MMIKNLLRLAGVAGLLLTQSPAAPYTAQQIQQLAEETARDIMQSVNAAFDLKSIHAIMDAEWTGGTFDPASILSTGAVQKPYKIVHLEPKGWVIVATDDRVKPIIGYSMESTIGDTLPPAMEAYLSWASETISSYIATADEVPYAKKMGDEKSVSTAGAAGSSVQVGPLLKDGDQPIQWGQGYYFNRYTPADKKAYGSLKGHVPVGCGATAMGQIMRFWKWPKKRNPIPGYTDNRYGKLKASDKLTYDWTKMPAAPKAVSDEISRLLFDAGLAQKMGYSPSGSWSSLDGVRDAFRDYFKYSSDVVMAFKSDYKSDRWATMIQSDLDNHRPVFYRGADRHNNNGHFFVLDGYKKANNRTEYHVNWGWHPGAGGADGWFALDSLTPEGQGNFTGYQMALFRVHPDRNDVEEEPAGSDLAIASASVSKRTITQGGTVVLQASIKNQGASESAASTVHYYLSTNRAIDVDDAELGTGAVNALAPDAIQAVRKTVKIDRNSGTYYLGVCVDTVADETNTNNQCSKGIKLTVKAKVTPKPDPKPDPEPEPEPKPKPDPEPKPKPDPVVKPKPKPEPVVEPAPEPEPVVTPEPEPVVDPEPVVAPETQPDTEETDETEPVLFDILEFGFDWDMDQWFQDWFGETDFGLDQWFK